MFSVVKALNTKHTKIYLRCISEMYTNAWERDCIGEGRVFIHHIRTILTPSLMFSLSWNCSMMSEPSDLFGVYSCREIQRHSRTPYNSVIPSQQTDPTRYITDSVFIFNQLSRTSWPWLDGWMCINSTLKLRPAWSLVLLTCCSDHGNTHWWDICLWDVNTVVPPEVFRG